MSGLHRGGPHQLWLADITEHRTGEGKLYLCAVKDACSNRIVGYAISDRPRKILDWKTPAHVFEEQLREPDWASSIGRRYTGLLKRA